jgi:hypothetical protein
MKAVITPPEATAFEATLQCGNCHTTFTAEVADLEYDGFKVSGYEFAGTAEYEYKFFVPCPSNCGHLTFIDPNQIGVLLRQELIKKRSR